MNDIRKMIDSEQRSHSKLSHWIQMILFLAMFTGLFLLGCKLFSGFWMRALSLLIAYFISSLVTVIVIKPLCDKIEAKRKK